MDDTEVRELSIPPVTPSFVEVRIGLVYHYSATANSVLFDDVTCSW